MKKFPQALLICIFFYWELSSVKASNVKSLEFEHGIIINRMAVRMLTNCYMDFKTLVVHGEIDRSTFKSIRNTQMFFVPTAISDLSMINVGVEQRTQMSIFLMTPNSDKQFQEILITFKKSPWWNIMNPLFILDKSNQGCDNAQDILESAWRMNVVKSFFLCVNSDKVPMIYTYNPYTTRAPLPWKKAQTIKKRSDGWTMYLRAHHEGYCCKSFNFDRTKYLDGSVVRVVTNLPEHHTWIPGKNYDETIMEKMFEQDRVNAEAMKYALNVTLVFNIDEAAFGTDVESRGFYRHLRNGSCDIALCLRSPYVYRNFITTYPAAHSKYYIATNNRGFYTPWEKIKNYYGIVTLISMSIILLMTFVVIVFSGKERRWSFAGFEILRLIVNAAIHSRMISSSRRIFFSMIFLYFLIIHATFQGHLSAFLTKDEYRKNVESLEDLKDSRYNAVHIAPGAVPIIEDPLLKAKLIVGHPNCSSKILGKPSEACITDIYYLHKVAFEQKLHLSKKPVSPSQYSYAVRDDWPLKERVDIFLMRLEQSGISRRWDEEYLKKEKARQKRILARSEVNFRPISLPMLEFAYVIFGIGLTLAIVCFLLEKLNRSTCCRKKKNIRVERKIINVRRALRSRRRLTTNL